MRNNRAVLYRAGSKSTAVTSFAAAAIIHLSAVAFASFHREAAPSAPNVEVEVSGDDLPPVDISPAVPPEIILDSPAVNPDQEFAEREPTPRVKEKRPNTGPVHPPGSAARGPVNTQTNTLSAPRPEYPYEARRRGLTGAGVAVLDLDPPSGRVTNARMVQSTGSSVLDSSSLSAFRRWRFKPGSAPTVRIPVIFTLSGASL